MVTHAQAIDVIAKILQNFESACIARQLGFRDLHINLCFYDVEVRGRTIWNPTAFRIVAVPWTQVSLRNF